MSFVKIEQRMYGDYLCSCGCGKPLGHALVTQSEICYGVGDEADEEGYEWRMFTKQCWERISHTTSLDDIWEKYPISPVNEASLPM